MTPPTVSERELNRWTLARQMLLERERIDAVTAVGRLAGMQAQYSPSPYIGLWSRVAGFERSELEAAVAEDRVVKATLMRGTLHLVPASVFDQFRAATRNPYHLATVKRLVAHGVDVAAIRAEIIAAVAQAPLTRAEIARLTAHHLSADGPFWGGWSAVAVAGDLVNLADDARFGYFGGSRYRVAPPPACDPAEARRVVVEAYFSAFGPATRADFAQWSGRNVSDYADALASLDLIEFRSQDGRRLLDLREALRPDAGTAAPVRFLPKWDNLLLAHARRERVLPDSYRRTVIRKNGDVLPTFLVDGSVAGTWEAPLRGRAQITLRPFGRLAARTRREVEAEAERLVRWLRPETDRRELIWRIADGSL